MNKLCELLEAISKIEKWFEVKPLARRAYAPEGTAQSRDESSTTGREFI
jgi:hypothetical protein